MRLHSYDDGTSKCILIACRMLMALASPALQLTLTRLPLTFANEHFRQPASTPMAMSIALQRWALVAGAPKDAYTNAIVFAFTDCCSSCSSWLGTQCKKSKQQSRSLQGYITKFKRKNLISKLSISSTN